MSGSWRDVGVMQAFDGHPQPRRALADPHVVSVPEAAEPARHIVRTWPTTWPDGPSYRARSSWGGAGGSAWSSSGLPYMGPKTVLAQ
jgi:hypothetical protein